MLGKEPGVTKRLNDENEKDLPMHCVSLFVKSIDNAYIGMRDFMDTCLEIGKLINLIPKRQTMIEKMKMKYRIMEEIHDDLEDDKILITMLSFA